MEVREQPALHILDKPLLEECLGGVLRARVEMDWPTDSDAEVAVNVHLAHVLTQGFLGDGLHTLNQHAFDVRLVLLEKGSPEQRCRQAWKTGTICLFVFSQQVATRTGRHRGRSAPVTWCALVSLGSQAYDMAASLERRETSRLDVAYRLSKGFEEYGFLARQAGMIMGFHERFDRLIDPRYASVILDEVFDARRGYEQSRSRVDWQRLQAAIAHYRQYDPDFSMPLPPEPSV